MELDNQRRSSNVEDRRGRGGGGFGGGGLQGGLPLGGRRIGIVGLVIIGVILLLNPFGMRDLILSQLTSEGGGASLSAPGASGGSGAAPGGACVEGEAACDFVSRILGSTEDVWGQQFAQRRLPTYGETIPGSYEQPRLVLFSDQVSTGCGGANSGMGPFYCPADRRVYIDPTFYDTLARRLNAPGDFAQAYVVAHEVGHHIQNIIGATRVRLNEPRNQTSVRIELQADCLAGVWGHTARSNLQINEADLAEALGAAHAIGDDTLQRNSRGSVSPDQFTHGTSEQRMRWFRRGFQTGDARQCDTLRLPASQL